jgi:hypothetical protein
MTDDRRTEALNLVEQGVKYPEIAKAVYGPEASLTLLERSSKGSYAKPRVSIPKTTTRSAGRHMRGKRRGERDWVLLGLVIMLLVATFTQTILGIAILTSSR